MKSNKKNLKERRKITASYSRQKLKNGLRSNLHLTSLALSSIAYASIPWVKIDHSLSVKRFLLLEPSRLTETAGTY